MGNQIGFYTGKGVKLFGGGWAWRVKRDSRFPANFRGWCEAEVFAKNYGEAEARFVRAATKAEADAYEAKYFPPVPMSLTDSSSHYAGCRKVGEVLEKAIEVARAQDITCVDRWTSGMILVYVKHAGLACDMVFELHINGEVRAKKYNDRDERFEEVITNPVIKGKVNDLFSLAPLNFAAKEREFWARHAKALATIPIGTKSNRGYFFLSTECCYATALGRLQDIGQGSRGNWRERWLLLGLAESEIASAPTADARMAEILQPPGSAAALAQFAFGPRD